MPVPAPYDRGRFNRALITNALLDPFNIVLLAVVLIAGILLNVFVFTLPVAAALYLAGAARTYFDEDVAKFYRGLGHGYQARMNMVLRTYMLGVLSRHIRIRKNQDFAGRPL